MRQQTKHWSQSRQSLDVTPLVDRYASAKRTTDGRTLSWWVYLCGNGPPFRRSATPKVLSANANRLVKPFPRIPRVRVRVRVRLDQPAIQVSSRFFGMADLRSGGPKSNVCNLSGITSDSQPYNSLPGANRPIGPWPIRCLELSLHGAKLYVNFRSLELLHSRVFAPRNIRSLELSLFVIPWRLYSNDMYLWHSNVTFLLIRNCLIERCRVPYKPYYNKRWICLILLLYWL